MNRRVLAVAVPTTLALLAGCATIFGLDPGELDTADSGAADSLVAGETQTTDSSDTGAAESAPDTTVTSDSAETTDSVVDSVATDSADSGLIDALADGDGGCGDTTSSSANCGACGYGCRNGRTCVASRCAPAWQALPTTGAPSARGAMAASTLGGKYYVFGGTPVLAGSLADGGVYDPIANAWSAMPVLKSARCAHAATSSGSKIFTFGGLSDCSNGASVGPAFESFDGSAWSVVAASGEPGLRYNFSMTWTGSDVFLYGGGNNSGPALSSGGRYSPGSGTWTDASCSLSGCQRGGEFSTFLDGGVIRLWAGGPFGSAPGGLQYDLTSKVWSDWTVPTGTPTSIAHLRADDGRRIYILRNKSTCPSGGVEVQTFDRKTGSWATDGAATPSGLSGAAAAVWIDGEVYAFGGGCGSGSSGVGGRYQPPAP